MSGVNWVWEKGEDADRGVTAAKKKSSITRVVKKNLEDIRINLLGVL